MVRKEKWTMKTEEITSSYGKASNKQMLKKVVIQEVLSKAPKALAFCKARPERLICVLYLPRRATLLRRT